MTKNEFLKKYKQENKLEKLWNYSICVFFIFGSIIFLYKILSLDNWYKAPIGVKILIPSLAIIVIATSIYGFWKIPKSYKLIKIKADDQIENNIKVINEVQKKLQLITIEKDLNYFKFEFKGKLWSRFSVYTFLEKENIYINVQSHDYSNNGGFIDFGAADRVTKKIKNEIKTSC